MEWPDRHHFRAAVGWLELGNLSEARAELDCVSGRHRTLPEVLALDSQLLAAGKEWTQAAGVAEAWVEAIPDNPEAWIHRSYALHELGRTQDAWDKLLPAATLFPGISTIAYNLACYACQLSELDAARRWLRRTMTTLQNQGERSSWRLAAQQDPDLKPLWDEIRSGTLR